ncbi:MAG: hypothetical protein Q8L39_13920 [Burkholderiales bacterium]|nr:hypothetical protein [Burkholderiales bacterium]
MSYDYLFFRLKRPISSHLEIGSDTIMNLGSVDYVKKWITENFPNIVWTNAGHTVWGVLILDDVHLEIFLGRTEKTTLDSFRVGTSYHEHSLQQIQRIADALQLTAFDMQTCDLFSPTAADE